MLALLTRGRPWRSPLLAHGITLLALSIGVPWFVRMPPWCDLTLYDVAAKTLLDGGVHYRDVFDTNLPGFVWLLTLIRGAFGNSCEVIRAVDLLMVALIAWQLQRLARRAGANRLHRAWLIAGVAVFYPFTTEFNHAQRDVWMMVPALAAVLLRERRLRVASIARRRQQVLHHYTFLRSLLEGLCWGVGVWVKPHLILIAVAVWLLTTAFMCQRRIVWRSVVIDAAGNFTGGALVGALGVGWLMRTGTWPYFVDVLTNWLPHYSQYTQTELPRRLGDQFWYFTPWSLMQPFALVLTLLDIVAAWRPRTMRRLPTSHYRPATSPPRRLTRLLLAAVFWAWVLQGLLIQRRFHYVHVPETLLLFAIMATHRWACVPIGVGIILVASVWYIVKDATSEVPTVPAPGQVYFEKHPLFERSRLEQWPNCWRSLPPQAYRERQDHLAQLNGSFPSISVAECGEVADFLNPRRVRADEVIAWHDSPHAVYLALPGRPAFRFMHVDTALLSPVTYAWMWDECRSQSVPRAKYVVIDLVRLYVTRPDGSTRDWRTAGEDLLPVSVPATAREVFPYNQPAVFRSAHGIGRYVVLKCVNPVTASEYDDAKDIWTRNR